MPQPPLSAEKQRLAEDHAGSHAWRLWGPYLSERAWGTVREDYSADGNAWAYFPHEHARSRAFRWGEDGIAGVCDEEQRLCLALALWNGRDDILKERLFGLTNGEGNHGEDVKELYYYLDAMPTHSYLKMLYKYPQRAFPYAAFIEESRLRTRQHTEFELLETGVFDDDRYFDVFVEYAKAAPDDILMRVTAHNRGPAAAVLHVLPQLWFRNTWTWGKAVKGMLSMTQSGVIETSNTNIGSYTLYTDGSPTLLFCDNETNPRIFGNNGVGYFKDAIHEFVIRGDTNAVNPARTGTKAAAHYTLSIPAGGSVSVRLRLRPATHKNPFTDFDDVFAQRKAEADAFYAELQQDIASEDARRVQRQALAGLIWSRQFYYYDIPEWIKGDRGLPPPPPQRRHGRNSDWMHLNNADVLTMPDKWEYPYYCAWDTAFQCVALALIDPEWAKRELVLMTREWFMHPNGQLAAYEWNFGDVNPPVHAYAAWRVFQIDRRRRGDCGDLVFLERVFHKLLLNFTWWVNRKDAQGRNLFQGGFLGLDNIGVFDRSAALPTGGFINQADGTSWMAMYCLNLMRIALELALHNHVYEDIATKFFEHFLEIAHAMTNIGGDGEGIGLWNENDGFYYDQLILPDDRMVDLHVRSMVGLIPLFAVEVLDPELLDKLPDFSRRLNWFLNYRPDLCKLVSRWHEPGRGDRRLLSLLRGHRIKMLLRRMLDASEFLSDHGIRALSRKHLDQPYTFWAGGVAHTVAYISGESDSGLFGGNSNWRGPVWFPVNFLLIESLQRFHHYYGDDFKVECPTGSGKFLNLNEVSDELIRRLSRLFVRDEQGRRTVFGQNAKMQTDPHFRDYILFHEYFDGDSGRGLGASHQTGWTALIAKLLQPRRPEPVQPCLPPRAKS